MMENTRPVGILRYNAEVMRNNGAPQEIIAKYLKDNGSSFTQIAAVPSPNQEQVTRMLASEKDGTFAAGQKTIAEAAERAQQLKDKNEKWAIAQGVARGIGDGLLWGTADEIESAITGEPVKEIRAEQQQYIKEHPVLGIGSIVGGAMLNPTGALGGAARGASLGEKVLRGAIQGGAQGALYGFGSGEGLGDRLEMAAKRGALGAGIGAATPVVVEGVKAVGRGIADVTGLTSGAGGESLKRGFDAGARNSETFKNAMRGKSGVYDVVDDVDKAVRTMERNASAKYKAMLPDNGATLKLSDKAFKNALKEATDSISGITSGVDDVASNAVNKVHKLAANIKAKGGLTFDNALEAKKAIDGIIEPLSRSGEKNAVRLLTPIKNALNETMENAVPAYNGARAAFRADTRLIDSIKSALTSKDPTTELRKIQGITRQSVAAAQGGKQELGRILDDVSGGRILDAVAGGQVQQWIPRDPVRALTAGGAALGTRALSSNPFGWATLGTFSPRLLGEISYALGYTGSKIPVSKLSYPALRVVEALKTRFNKGE